MDPWQVYRWVTLGTDIITLRIGTEMVAETETLNHLTWLIAGEDFVKLFTLFHDGEFCTNVKN
jgi:hypothetical protein